MGRPKRAQLETVGEVAERFWSKVNVVDEGCWLWTAGKDKAGYGAFGLYGRMTRAPRIAWALVFGDAGDAYVLHRCDVPACVNPGHLFLGTHGDNMADMASKGRASKVKPKGSAHGRAKLTEDIVRDIRRRVADGATKVSLAAEYGVSNQLVCMVVARQIWSHVP